MSSNLEKALLVPTDFSEACDNALNHALELAKHFDAKVYVLHVINKDTKQYLKKINLEASAIDQRLNEYLEEKGEERLIGIAREGDIYTTIADVANEINAKMIFLGTHGKIGFQRITGSHALKVIDHNNAPVVVVQKRGFGNGYKKIVFPVSLEHEDRQKAEFAVIMAKMFNSTIHIFPKYETGEEHQKKIMPIVKQIKTYFDKYEVHHTDSLSNEWADDFDKAILNYSNTIDADLVLIMNNSKKHGPLFGGWEENIIFNAGQIPVMCVDTKKLNVKGWRDSSAGW